jgi:membrane peptidoglycan carboxypeptidase
MATAFATIANDGIRNQPHIIKEIRDSDGNIVSATEPNQSQVVSADSARSLRTMLRQVVLTGTGRRAQLDGYSSAGKTGTAWKFDAKTRRVERSKYVSSFIGFAPAEDPRLLIAVVMDEPKSGARDGGGVSAPIFKEIAQRVLKDMNVPPDLTGADQTNAADDIPEAVQTTQPTAVSGPPERDRPETSTKPAVPSSDRPDAKPLKRTEKAMPSAVKMAVLPAALKSSKSPSVIWKSKPKT